MVAYAFRHGVYSLYVNYPSQCPHKQCTLVTTFPTKKRKQTLYEDQVDLPPLLPAVLVPAGHFPLYDFLFQRVNNEVSLLHRWKLHSRIKTNPCNV